MGQLHWDSQSKLTDYSGKEQLNWLLKACSSLNKEEMVKDLYAETTMQRSWAK